MEQTTDTDQDGNVHIIEDSHATCRDCHHTYQDYEPQYGGCPKCGATHSGDTNGDEVRYRNAAGEIREGHVLDMCRACWPVTFYERDTREIILPENFIR